MTDLKAALDEALRRAAAQRRRYRLADSHPAFRLRALSVTRAIGCRFRVGRRGDPPGICGLAPSRKPIVRPEP
jgi:hypothetical protein